MRLLRGLLASLGVTLLIVGIAGPQWGRDYSQTAAPGRDLVVVLDLSRSMLAEQPSRLHRAKQALADLAEELKQRGGHRVALVVFAGRAKVVCPLTHDYDHFAEALEELDGNHRPPAIDPPDDNASGTRIGLGIRAALELHEPRFAGYQDVLLLSDGDDPGTDGGDWRIPAAEARRRGIPIHTVGIGNPNEDTLLKLDDSEVKTRLREAPLQEIAEISEGIYISAQTQGLPLGRLFRERIESRPLHEDTEDALPLYQQHYAWFLGGSLLLLSLSIVVSAFSRPQPIQPDRFTAPIVEVR